MTSRVNPNNDTAEVSITDVLGTGADPSTREIQTHADGPKGTVPFTAEFLIEEPSGNHFGMTQNAGMGWNPSELMRKQFIILSTVGGVKEEDGSPIALGLHTGHFELVDMVKTAAKEFKKLKSVPFAAFCSDLPHFPVSQNGLRL